MATRKTARKSSSTSSTPASIPTIIYVHGIGKQEPEEVVKRAWDIALFGKDMGDYSRMAYWADILHGNEASGPELSQMKTSLPDELDPASILAEAGVGITKKTRAFVAGILRPLQQQKENLPAKVLPLPSFLRKPLARFLLRVFVKDSAAYFYTPGMRQKMQERLRRLLPEDQQGDSLIIMAHSQGSVIALEVLADLQKRNASIKIDKLITIGSPLGITEIQDNLTCGTVIPKKIIGAWYNFADPVDPVALDKGIRNDFDDPGFIVDTLILNTKSRKLSGFNPHAALGYLANPRVREAVHS